MRRAYRPAQLVSAFNFYANLSAIEENTQELFEVSLGLVSEIMRLQSAVTMGTGPHITTGNIGGVEAAHR